jgi:drug/metabolite transporter (DMT)-like permease
VAYLRLFGAQLAIGAAAIFARFALTGTGPLWASTLRLAIAAAPLVLLALLSGKARPGRKAEFAFFGAGIALAVHFGAWLASLLYTSVAVSTLLVCTSPIWTGLYDALVLRVPVARSFLAAVALAAVGLGLVASERTSPAPQPGHTIEGAALALLGSLGIGAYLLIVRAAGPRPDGTRMATRDIVARTYSWAAIALLPLALLSGGGPPAVTDATAWLGILAMALVSQSLGHTGLNAALRDFTPSAVAMSTLLEPVFAAALAAAIFRETLSWQAAAGGGLVLAAILIALRSDPRAPTGPEIAMD